jgi:abnormal spindle-like microcephaly-associated protein
MSRMKATLKNVIVTRLLADPETLRKYTKGRCNVPSGRFEKEYREEIRILILTRLLVLVAFLDKAKMASVLDRVPRLFIKEAKVKSTRDVLVSLCRDFLSAEGDIIKHLSRIGLKVAYKQEPIDELDFTVTNLAADIRDGVRLARMEEILTNVPPKSLLATLRLPAVSRLQKLHNVGAVLDTLCQRGVPNVGEVAAHHIVDGYREQVLKLLWTIVANSGIGAVLDPSAVEDEIHKVEHANRTKLVNWDLRDIMTASYREMVPFEGNESDEDIMRPLLLRWCNAVIAPFGVQVTDYTASFADGIAICLLIHYYHPALIRLDEIERTSRHGLSIDEALANERLNLNMASERMSELGGIPKLLPMGDSRNPPEDKSMLLCLVYLCSRLMESSSEVLACQAIQHWYRHKKRIELMGKKIEASKVIRQAWQERKVVYYHAQQMKYGNSVRIIEGFIYANKDRLYALRKAREYGDVRIRCVTGLQALVRGRQARQKVGPLLRRNTSVLMIQKNWRISRIQRALDTQKLRRLSAVTIQKLWRGYLAYANLSTVLWGATKIQAVVRGIAIRKCRAEQIAASVQIQRIWRGFMCQVHLHVALLDVVTVQSVARRYNAAKLRSQKMASIVKLQQFVRTRRAVRILQKKVNDKRIQRQQDTAVVLMQRLARGRLARQSIANNVVSCIRIQAAFRGFLIRLNAKGANTSALVLQTKWRQYMQRKNFANSRRAIVAIQRFSRRRLKQNERQLADSSAVLIQAVWRQFTKRMDYHDAIFSAITIQSIFRQKLAARATATRMKAVVVIQKHVRMWKASQVAELEKMKHRALVQAERERDSVIRIQSVARRMISVAHVKNVREIQENNAATLWWAGIIIQTFTHVCLAKSFTCAVRRDRIARCERKSAIILQSIARRFLSLAEAHRRRGLRHSAAIRLQTMWRGSAATKQLKAYVAAASVLQRVFRGFKIRTEMKRLSVNARIVQSAWRLFLFQKSASIEAVTTMQRMMRGAKVRSEMRMLTSKAQKVQATWRMLQMKNKYKSTLHSIVVIQSLARRHVAEASVGVKNASVLTVQAFGRIVLAKLLVQKLVFDKVNFMISTSSAIRIQVSRQPAVHLLSKAYTTHSLTDISNVSTVFFEGISSQEVTQQSAAGRHRYTERMEVFQCIPPVSV